jgi:hypothetical protein
MAFSIDPATLIGNAVANVVKRSVIVGLPSPSAKIPSFILCEIPEEKATGSVQLSSLQIADGDLSSKSAVNGGEYNIKIALSEDDTVPSAWLRTVSTILSTLTSLANTITNFGGVLPNLSAVTSSYVGSQIATLFAMKNNRQPITILQAYINLGTISQTSPFLKSEWFIESIDIDAAEGEQGAVLMLTLREQMKKRDAGFGVGSLLKNLAGELGSPLAGAALGSVL